MNVHLSVYVSECECEYGCGCEYLVLGMWVRTSSTPNRSRPERKLKKVLAAVASSPCTRLYPKQTAFAHALL